MSATTRKMTVAEYAQVPPPPDGRWELRNGELVKVTFPIQRHSDVVVALLRALFARSGTQYIVAPEYAFRPKPEYEVRAADVAVVARARWSAVDRASWLKGAPEIAIEVLSPSNTAVEMREKAGLCLENGAFEFWVVDPQQKSVTVETPDRRAITYVSGDAIPLPLFDSAPPLTVDEIFSN